MSGRRWGVLRLITRLSYVYLTYMLRISYVIDSGKIKVSPYFHIKKCVDTTNMGGRTYPVRYYPVAIRLRDRKGRAVLCSHYFLSVGTLRVLHSECVPSHSFTPTRKRPLKKLYKGITKNTLHNNPRMCMRVLLLIFLEKSVD